MAIDLARARELLAQAVQTQGRDFVYNPGGEYVCHYAPVAGGDTSDPRTRTGCLVGVALSLAGETRHLEARYRNVGILALSNVLHGLIADRVTAQYLHEAQRSQDEGKSWGEAFDDAERYVSMYIDTK